MRTRTIAIALLCSGWALTSAEIAEARVGGGQSYSSGRSSSPSSSSYSGSRSSSSSRSYSPSRSSSSSSSRSSSRSSPSRTTSSGGYSPNYVGGPNVGPDFGIFLFVVFAGVLLFFVKLWWEQADRGGFHYESTEPAYQPPPPPRPKSGVAARMKRLDRAFSETVFLEWAALLFARFHEVRALKDLDAIAPYLNGIVRANAQTRPQEGVPPKEIRGLVIGGIRLEELKTNETMKQLLLVVSFRASYTAVFDDGTHKAYWTDELWTFARDRNGVSRKPEDVERLGCPSCGSALERSSVGRCSHCNNTLQPGEVDWCVWSRQVRELKAIPPVLTGTVEEVGTDLPTIRQPGLQAALQRIPQLSAARFTQRAQHAFMALQDGWSAGDLEEIRPFETDSLFGQHRFWLEEYTRQGLRNRLDDLQLTDVDIVKVDDDLYYNAITCRMHASANDYTIRLSDKRIVAGSNRFRREWTEYWTFVRRKGATEAQSDVNCPSCTAPLKVTHTGVCAHCGTKLTRGDFDWVLSRIEQDEEYVG